jgi:hypothetical protein
MNWRNPAFDHQRGGESDVYSEYISAGDQATHELLATRLREAFNLCVGQLPVTDFYAVPSLGFGDRLGLVETSDRSEQASC